MEYKHRNTIGFIALALAICLLPEAATAFGGLDTTVNQAGLDKFGSDIPTIIGNIIGTALSMIAVIFFIITVYGGFVWMTARGKAEQSKKALDTIVAAVIGMLIVLGANALTIFVFNSLGDNRGDFGGPNTPPPSSDTRIDQNQNRDQNPGQQQIDYYLACTCRDVLDDPEDEICEVLGPIAFNPAPTEQVAENRCSFFCDNQLNAEEFEVSAYVATSAEDAGGQCLR